MSTKVETFALWAMSTRTRCEEQELHVAVVTQPDQEKHLSTAISQELAHIHSPNPAFCFVCCCSQNDTDEKNEVIAVQAMFQGFSEACQKFGFLETGNDGRRFVVLLRDDATADGSFGKVPVVYG